MQHGENIEDTFVFIVNMLVNDDEGDLDSQASLIQSTRRILSEELS